jgi:hypothetical protein
MPTLADAIAAIKSGRLNDGRIMLAQILAADDHNVTALLWMTEVAATPEELRIYLKRVLVIDPANAPARKGLELLDKANEPLPLAETAQPPTSQPPSAAPAHDHTMPPAERKLQPAPVTTLAPVKVSTPRAKWTTIQKMILAAIVAIVALIVVAVAWSVVARSLPEQSAISAPAATPKPFPTEQQTPAPTPNPYPVLGDLREYPWVDELDLAKRPDDYKNKPVCLDEMRVFGVREERGVTTFGIQSGSDNSTVIGTVVYVGTIPDLVDSFSIIFGGYVVGTEADLNISSSSRPVILMQRFHSYSPAGMFNNYTVGDESAKKCNPPES